MKGQIYILVSVIVAAILLIVVSPASVAQFKEQQTVNLFKHLKGEVINTVDLTLLNQEDIDTNLGEFTSFVDTIYESRGYVVDIDYRVTTGPLTLVSVNMSLSSDDGSLKDNFNIIRRVYT